MGLTRTEILFPLVVAFVARTAMLPFAHLSDPNLWEYGDIARHLLHGDGYAFTWLTPLLPAFSATSAIMPPGETFVQFFALKLFGDALPAYIAIFLLQVLCGVGFTYVIGRLTHKLFRARRIVLIGLWSAAIYPSFVYATATFGVASEILLLNSLFLYTAVLLYDAIKEEKKVFKRILGFGTVAGLLGYFRSEAPLPVFGALLLMLFLQRHSLRRAFGPVIAVALLFAAMQAPWTLRNYQTFHTFIPGSTSGGYNFWKGNSAAATGSGWDESGIVVSPTLGEWMKVYELGKADASFDIHFSDALKARATEWISSHPTEEALLVAKKVILLWTIDRNNPLARSWEYIVLYAATLLLVVVGWISWLRTKRVGSQFGQLLIGLCCLIYTALAAAFFVVPRYQIFMIGCYWPFVAFGIEAVLARRKPTIAASHEGRNRTDRGSNTKPQTKQVGAPKLILKAQKHSLS